MFSNVLNLDEKRGWFRDEKSFAEFVEYVKSVAERDVVAVFSEKLMLCTLLSRGATKEFLSERIMQKFSEDPQLLEELTSRMESDESVEDENL